MQSVKSILSLLDDNGAKKPPKGGTGAHISAFLSEEVEDIDVKEIGQEFSFTLGKMVSLKPEGWNEMKKVWFLEVKSPELEKLRKKYDCPAKIHGHEFHITIGVEKV